MLDKQVFSAGISHLQAYYSRTIPDFAQRVWYKHFAQQLTTEQFQQAIEAAIVHKTHLPTPEEMVQMVRGDDKQLAIREWDLCLEAIRRGHYSLEAVGVSEVGEQAIQSVGGLRSVGLSQQDQLTWLKKDFIEAWKSYRKVPNPIALPPAESPWAVLPESTGTVNAIARTNGNGARV